jgi:hypothetical protein
MEGLDDTNSKSNGLETLVGGIQSGEGSAEFYLDLSDNPITAVEPGTGVTLLLHVNATKKLSAVAYCESFEVNMPVRGKVTCTLNFRASAYDFVTDLANIASA